MHIEFNDDHGIQRWQNLYKPTWLRAARPHLYRGVVKCICFMAAPALVATMLAAGLPVRSHPLHREQLVVPAGTLSELQLRDLIGNRDFVFLSTVVFFTTPVTTNNTWTSDATWNNSNNQVECVGGGGSGGVTVGTAGSGRACGGSGAAYSLISNFSIATPGTTTVTWQTGKGGAAANKTGSLTSSLAGNAGGVTWWNAASNPGAGSDNSKCSAVNGAAGLVSTSATVGPVSGGASASCWGTTKFSGGNAGSGAASGGDGASGGGGAAGPNAAGVASSNASNSATAGGQGDGTHGGTGSAGASGGTASVTSSPGNPGAEWTSTASPTGGSGGGSGAAKNTISSGATATAGTAGNYGAGGGAATYSSVGGTNSATSGAGAPGIVVITWTPTVVTVPYGWWNQQDIWTVAGAKKVDLLPAEAPQIPAQTTLSQSGWEHVADIGKTQRTIRLLDEAAHDPQNIVVVTPTDVSPFGWARTNDLGRTRLLGSAGANESVLAPTLRAQGLVGPVVPQTELVFARQVRRDNDIPAIFLVPSAPVGWHFAEQEQSRRLPGPRLLDQNITVIQPASGEFLASYVSQWLNGDLSRTLAGKRQLDEAILPFFSLLQSVAADLTQNDMLPVLARLRQLGEIETVFSRLAAATPSVFWLEEPPLVQRRALRMEGEIVYPLFVPTAVAAAVLDWLTNELGPLPPKLRAGLASATEAPFLIVPVPPTSVAAINKFMQVHMGAMGFIPIGEAT